MVPLPLWPDGEQHESNPAYIRAHLVRLLATSFPNIPEPQVDVLVRRMFETVDDFAAFKNHCRDFLVQTKEFGGASNDELYEEEKAKAEAARVAAVPGLLNPNDIKDDEGSMDD